MLFTALLWAAQTLAQTPGQKASQQADRILQQQQQKQQKDLEAIEEGRRKQTGLQVKSPEVQSIRESDACFDIHHIDIQGADLMASDGDVLDNLAARFMGKCVGAARIQELLRGITLYYFDRGYITTKPYIPAQNLSTGTLKIIVIEGKIESLHYKDSKNQKELNAAFPINEGELLNLRDLEQGIDQLNRLSTNDAKLELLPGKTPGGSIVQVENTPSRRYLATVKMDNSGQSNTGEWQKKFSYLHENLFGRADLLSLNYQSDLGQFGHGGTSENMSLYAEVPFGYWTFGLSANKYRYHSTVEGFATVFSTSGTSETLAVTASRVLHRDKISKTSLELGLKRKDNGNYLEGIRLDSATRVLTIGNIGISHTRSLLGGRLTADFSYLRGMKWLHALADDDENMTRATPHAQFDKYQLDITYMRAFEAAARKFLYQGELHYQHSPDALYGTEHMSIGGQYTVAAYKDNGYSAETGLRMRHSLEMSLYKPKAEKLKRMLGTTYLRAGFDAGWVRDKYTDTRKHDRRLQSWSIGLLSRGGRFTYEMEYARGVGPRRFDDKRAEEFYLSVSYQF